LGLSPYATPLDVYKHKKGVDRPFDPLLGWIGHQSEPIMAAWLDEFSGLGLTLEPAFMARSVEYPFLHASFDRVARNVWHEGREYAFVPVQMKTAHQFTGHAWDEGVPVDIRVQVQGEMVVSGAEIALVVVWIGGREFRTYWEPRDHRFIVDHLIPGAEALWAHVQQDHPPQPSTVGELAEQWPGEADQMEAPAELVERIEQRAFLLAAAREAEEDAKTIQVAIGQWMLENRVDTFTVRGRKILTYKRQNGRASFDAAALKRDHPELVEQYTTQGAPFMVMRSYKPKEKK
jgi:predicted phage-related endonuclease